MVMPRAFLPVPRQFGRSLWLRRRTAAKTVVIAAVSVVCRGRRGRSCQR
jgi:hypothetical protein